MIRLQSVAARSVKIGGPFRSLDESKGSTISAISPVGTSSFDNSMASR